MRNRAWCCVAAGVAVVLAGVGVAGAEGVKLVPPEKRLKQLKAADAKVIEEALAILDSTQSRDTFYVAAGLLWKLKAPYEVVLPAILRGSDRLGIFRGAAGGKETEFAKVIEAFTDERHDQYMDVIQALKEKSETQRSGTTIGGCAGALGALIGSAVGSPNNEQEPSVGKAGAKPSRSDKPAKGKVCQLHANWQTTVAQTQDNVSGGVVRGIAGRIYLLPEKDLKPLDGDGEIVVDLYEERPAAGDNPPKHLEQWRFPAEVLKQLQRKDAIGWGYTLFLPGSSVRPGIARVQVRVCYTGKNGPTLYSSSSMTLHHGNVGTSVMPPKSEPVVEHGMTLPNGHYLRYPPQYVPVSTDGGPNAPPQK